jgi:hypothetical protein
MMRQASRYHAVRGMILLAGLSIASVTGFSVWHRALERNNADHAASLVQRLLDAETGQVPHIISEMDNYWHWTKPLLEGEYEKTAAGSRQQLHAGLALLPMDPSRKDYLFERLLDADPHELPILRDALFAHKHQFLDKLWIALEQPAKGQDNRRLRAACALASYDSDSPQWAQVADRTANDLVLVPPVHVEHWMDALRPVRAKLLDPLSVIFRDSKRESSERILAANILADYVSDRPGLLADLLMAADEKQFAVLYPKLKTQGEQALAPLRAELDKQPSPKWSEAPPKSLWKQPDSSLLAKIEGAHGLLADRFALCQTMSLEDFLVVAEELRPAGYRPVRFRPYRVDNGIRVAAVWSRDGKD